MGWATMSDHASGEDRGMDMGLGDCTPEHAAMGHCTMEADGDVVEFRFNV